MTSDINELDRTGDWSRFLKTSYKKEMGIIAREYPHVRSLTIRYADIERWGTTGIALADELVDNPGKVIEDIKVVDNVKVVQRLTGRIDSLGRFISRSSDRSHRFFSLLKKKCNFAWTSKCQ